MPRALWKGAITFGLVYIPVELHPAEKRDTLDLTLLDRRDLKPVGYQRVNKGSGKIVPWEKIVKGYEYKKDRYVVLSDEDFRRANVEATQTANIVRFVKADQIPLIYFDTPYYLVPQKRGVKTYALLRETLKRTEKAGIAYVVIRTRQHLAALTVVDSLIVLNTLRYAYEIRAAADLGVPKGGLKALNVHQKEIGMALKLVEEMSEDWDPGKYGDTYREDIMARVKEKVKAGETEVITEPGEETTEPAPRSAEVIDLMSLLKRSIDRKHGEDGAEQRRARPPHRARRRASGHARKRA